MGVSIFALIIVNFLKLLDYFIREFNEIFFNTQKIIKKLACIFLHT